MLFFFFFFLLKTNLERLVSRVRLCRLFHRVPPVRLLLQEDLECLQIQMGLKEKIYKDEW